MTMIKAPMIMKQNPLIMAEFEKAFSEVDHDVVNILLHSLQNVLKLDGDSVNLFNYEKIKNRKVAIAASTFKELGKFGKNSNKDIFESLKKISDTSAVIRDFRDVDNKFIKAKNIRIIDSVAWYKEGELEDRREQAFEVQFNEWFLQTSARQFNIQVGNFTNLELTSITSIKSKHGKKLYELLESQRYKQKTFAIKLPQLQKYFNMDDKQLSFIIRTIERVKPQVEKLIPFEYEVFKADKLISFNIIQK